MTWKQYLVDKSIFIVSQLLLYCGVILLLTIWSLPPIFAFLIALLCFSPLSMYFVYDYWRTAKFYRETTQILVQLDQAYLLPVIMKQPHFLTGKISYEWLKMSNRAMHEQVKLREQENNAYQEYVTTWVHEVKTPLAAANLLAQHVPDDTRLEMKQQLQAVEHYVEQALYYVKSTQANQDYHVRNFMIEPVIRQAIQTQSFALRAKNLQIVLKEKQTPVTSDPKWVQFILQQIIQNACQYSEQANQIIIRVKQEQAGVSVEIIDHGCGIAEHELQHICKKGYTGSNGREFAPSTGIGLYLCQRLVDKLHLQLTITSDQQNGTTVGLWFPNGGHHTLN